ncbi:hypothetical protein ACEUAI_12825 [Aeromonas veronii]|uniref:hypothetical protein n=1 Tax=Aeromonas hydrophila TaxID=644 RepID=UPI002B496A84|nr:hypothetical protein [Aeromonas hydrophila]
MNNSVRFGIPDDVLIQLFQDHQLSVAEPQYAECRKKVGNWLLRHINDMRIPTEGTEILQQLGLVSSKNNSMTKKGKWFLFSQYDDPRIS